MSLRRNYVLFVHDGPLFTPAGDVHRWAHQLGREVRESCRETAPPGHSESRHNHLATGRLRASIQLASKQTGKVFDLLVEADVPYAQYVHGGTAANGTRYIYSALGWANKAQIDKWIKAGTTSFDREADAGWEGAYMVLPPGPGGTKRFHMRVRGQRKNPFLVRGYNRVALLHDSLKKIHVG